jgi:hypothetical protein
MAEAASVESSTRNLQPPENTMRIGLMEKHLRMYWDVEPEGEQALLGLQSKLEVFTGFAIAAFFFFLFLELQYFISVPFEVSFVFLYLFHIYDTAIFARRYKLK